MSEQMFFLDKIKVPEVEQPDKNQVPGLQYISNYLSTTYHNNLLELVNKGKWDNSLKRRVQHYGYRYDYKARKVDPDMYLGGLPPWLLKTSRKLHYDGHLSFIPDQVIVNEYLPGQGISPHIDCEPCFDDTIISMSLGSSCIMDFVNKNNRFNKKYVFLEPRSLIILRGIARYDWLHSIRARKTDKWQGQTYNRDRRVSLTFRKVILT